MVEVYAVRRVEAVAVVTAGAVLLTLAPRPVRAAGTLAHTLTSSSDSRLDPTALVVALITLVAWALAGWLVVAALLLLAGRLPGLTGRLATRLAARTVPLAVRRCLEVALGASLALTTVGTLPASAGTGPGVVPTAAAAESLDWPTTPVAYQPVSPAPPARTAGPATGPTAAPGPGHAPDAVSAPTPPAQAVRATRDPTAGNPGAGNPGAGDATAGNRVRGPAAGPRAASPGPAHPRSPASTVASAAAGRVLVAPGDTLWDLAERSLQARGGAVPTTAAVAVAWPSWWATNREVIGDDPDLLRPGTSLRSP